MRGAAVAITQRHDRCNGVARCGKVCIVLWSTSLAIRIIAFMKFLLDIGDLKPPRREASQFRFYEFEITENRGIKNMVIFF